MADIKHHTMNSFLVIIKNETVLQMIKFSKWDSFNIFKIVEDALLKRFLTGRDRMYHI